jgi:hypothetical protein
MKITSDLTNLTTAILILTVQMFFEWTLFALRAFRFLITSIKIQFQKLTFFFLSSTPFFFYFFPLLYLFHSFYLPFVFIQYFSPLLYLPLSHFATSIPHVLDFLLHSLPQALRNFLCHTPPYFLLYLDSLILFLLSCLSVSLSLSLSSTFTHLPFALNFPLLHFSDSIFLSFFSMFFFSFLSSIPLVQRDFEGCTDILT